MNVFFSIWLITFIKTIIIFPYFYKKHYGTFLVGKLIEVILSCILLSQLGFWLSLIIPEDTLDDNENKYIAYCILTLIIILSFPYFIVSYVIHETGLYKKIWKKSFMNIELL